MKPSSRVTLTIVIVLGVAVWTLSSRGQTEPSTSQPATTQAAAVPSTRPVISADAKPVLEQMKKAYGSIKTVEMAGRVTGEFDVDGEKGNNVTDFTSSFESPNHFRHDAKDDGFVGSDGQKLYAWTKSKNVYLTVEAPKEKVMLADLPDPFGSLLVSQNPSLVLTISKDPFAELTQMYPKIDKADDVTIDKQAYPALKLVDAAGKRTMTLAFDPSTNLIRRAVIDLSDDLRARGAAKVSRADVTIDYTSTKTDATVKPEQFAWAAPAGSKDAAAAAELDLPGQELTGKSAPAFKLKDLAGNEVSLASLKGSVVVIDFWATWCPPCVDSLPHLAQLAKDTKADGVKVFAIDIGEDKPTVEEFLKQQSLSLNVLLDTDQKVGEAYKVPPIPTTFVIGKDGVIRKVTLPSVPALREELKAAIDAAVKAQ